MANGLTRERLLEQLDVVAELNEELQPFRILTGIEVDINEDGTLDQDADLLGRARRRRGQRPLEAPHGRSGDDRSAWWPPSPTPTSTSSVTAPAGSSSVGAGPSRPSTPSWCSPRARGSTPRSRSTAAPSASTRRKRLLRLAVESGCKVSIDTDAHAPGQLNWQRYGCTRAAECEVPA